MCRHGRGRVYSCVALRRSCALPASCCAHALDLAGIQTTALQSALFTIAAESVLMNVLDQAMPQAWHVCPDQAMR